MNHIPQIVAYIIMGGLLTGLFLGLVICGLGKLSERKANKHKTS